jgi:hypothetical protein
MDRAVRLSLFALGIIIASVFVVFASKAMNLHESRDDHGFGMLGEDVAQLRAEQALQSDLAEVHEAGREPLEESLQEQDLDGAELEDHVRERGKRRAALITAAAERESVDPDWGPATERQIIERFAIKAPAEFELLSAMCKTSICIAEVQTPSRKASIGQMGWHRFFGLSRAYVHHRGETDDGFHTVVFLARDGHSLPK